MPGGRASGTPIDITDIPDSVVDRLWDRLRVEGDHWIWTGPTTRSGHGQIWMNGRPFNPARIVFVLDHGHLDAGQQVKSTCGRPACLRHIEERDGLEGVRNPTVTPEVVAELRTRAATESDEQLSQAFGLTLAQVSRVRRNESYHDPDYVPHLRANEGGRGSRLNAALVTEARREHFVERTPVLRLAKRHGVPFSTMWEAVNNVTWKGLQSWV